MEAERWQKVKGLFDAALELAPNQRKRFLDKACGNDAEMRREVEKLLNSFPDDSFMEQPAATELASLIVERNSKLTDGKQIAHYRIVSQIGAGGMGEVYLAKDSRLNRNVALKVLPEYLTSDKSRLQRFEQEARAASALNHPNIITIYEIGAETDTHFIAAEYIEGETLRERLKSEPRLLKFALDAGVQIASALHAAHSAGIVHRDIKPENIMIRPDGLIKILDFGIAKLIEKKLEPVDTKATAIKISTIPGMIIGTANYMSPEQAAGRAVDTRSDIFSFGIVLYEMIAGRQPFEGDTAIEVIGSILNKEPAPLNQFYANVPPEIERIVGKTLKKDREERYQTVKDLLIDLKDARQELEFQNKSERTAAPLQVKAETQTFNQTTADAPHTTSSAEYLIGEIKTRKRGFAVGLTILLLASIGLGYWFFAARPAINSLAVLPFINASGDADLDYLSDGLSESVIDRLSQLPQLKVIARSSSFKYRGENVDVQDVANKLGVQAIVTGRVVQRGDDLSIRVEIVDARDNKQLWGEQYNRKAVDALVVQQEIAQTDSEKLRLKLSGAQEQQIAKQQTVNPQAYELLLRGQFYASKGGTENQKKANEYYRQATTVDPNYALAYARLSYSYAILVGNSVLDPKEFLPKAESATRRALELDENLAEAHLAMATLYRTAWDWAAAEAEYKRAIELNPNLSEAHRKYADYLRIIARHEEAVADAKRSRDLDPLGLYTNIFVSDVLLTARRYDEAIVEAKKTLELDKNYIFAYNLLGFTYAAKGMYREAIAAYEESNRLGDTSISMQIYLGAAYAQAGESEKAQAILKRLETSKEYVSPGELTVLYIGLGEREKAFVSLEKAYAAHDLQLQYLKADPAFDPLHDDPRFQDLLRRMNFPQ